MNLWDGSSPPFRFPLGASLSGVIALFMVFASPVLARSGGTPVEARVDGSRILSLAERVEAQRAIEQVYWKHRLWPAGNPGLKPPLSEVLSDAEIRARVVDYLRKCNALESIWGRTITHADLQTELDRMATRSHAPALLRELFEALGNDPDRIAETLARQTLADGLIRTAFASEERIHGELRRKVEADCAACRGVECMKAMGGQYHEATWKLWATGRRPVGRGVRFLDEAGWSNRVTGLTKRLEGAAISGAARVVSPIAECAEGFSVTAVLEQSDGVIKEATVVWPKTTFDAWWDEQSERAATEVTPLAGGYILATGPSPYDLWTPTSTGANVPSPRGHHTAVWTGTEMIVWGGLDDNNPFNTGGRYVPATDTWTPTSTGANVPLARAYHSAVWTGTQMVVWGGIPPGGQYFLSDGGRYNPTANTWQPTAPATGILGGMEGHTAVWTGTRMIVWGGRSEDNFLYTGGRYDPATDAWQATSTAANVPSARVAHTAVWTGSEMIVWGGRDGAGNAVRTGSRYSPSTDSWVKMSPYTPNVPSDRYSHVAVAAGGKMIVWGGTIGPQFFLNTGGCYDPSTDTWVATSTANVPVARYLHTAVWTGTEMIVFGGGDQLDLVAGGGRYLLSADTWTMGSMGYGTQRQDHTAVWAGSEMIVWGGFGIFDPANPNDRRYLNSGGHYGCPSDQFLYLDNDGDGYGNPNVPRACDFGGPPPSGYARGGTDCDDDNSSIHPDAPDAACNGIDNDCDGAVDDGHHPACTCVENGTGLMGWWRGNDNALDEVAGNHGTAAGAAIFGTGKVGDAFFLNGSSAYIAHIGDEHAFSFIENTGVFTVDAWILLNDLNQLASQAITASTGTTAEKGHFFLWENAAGEHQLRMVLTNGTNGVPRIDSRSPQNVITTGGWHHVAVTGNSYQVAFYVDGVAYSGSGVIGGATGNGGSTRPADIGRCPPASLCMFNGRIDEVQIYDRVLTPAEIRAIYATGAAGMCGTGCSSLPGLVGWWPAQFDGTDRSPFHVNLSWIGSARYTSGVVGASFEMFGSSALQAPDSPNLEVTSQLTLAAWVLPYLVATNNSARIISKWDVFGFAYELLINSNDNLQLRSNISNDGINSDALVSLASLSGWAHVATTFNSGAWKLYVNGVEVASKTSTITSIHSLGSSPLTIGGVTYGGSNFTGIIDEPLVFNRALQPYEIKALHDAGSRGACALDEVVSVEAPQAPRGSFALEAPWPNPSTRTTHVRFALPRAADVRAEVFDVAGRRVATLIDGERMTAGDQTAVWNGRDALGKLVGAGVFQIRVAVSGSVAVRKIVMVP